jgi:hypothetical protein
MLSRHIWSFSWAFILVLQMQAQTAAHQLTVQQLEAEAGAYRQELEDQEWAHAEERAGMQAQVGRLAPVVHSTIHFRLVSRV